MASTPIYLAFVVVCVVATSATATIYSFDDSRGVGRRFDGIGGLSGGGTRLRPHACFLLAAWLVIRGTYSATYTFDDRQGLGRRFDGVGGLSAGATSKLLVNYPQQYRDEILDYLFKPNFGASLQILKVEIGGDIQSTDGTEASHMHNSWEENYQRGYEWWLMTEAKKRNPDIKLYGLPWGFPGWIGQGTGNPYSNPNVTADYIVRWIAGAKTFYNLTIDFVGVWNERAYDSTYIKTLRALLDSRGFSSTRIVASDDNWNISWDILQDSALAAAVDYIGAHYPGTTSSSDAQKTGKQLWASEDYSTFNDETGGGCWARILNQNYAVGYMTSTISWNLIASYYNPLPFFRDGLMTAVEPWSGNYIVETPIWLSAHTTQFTEIGWKYLAHGAGVGQLQNGGSYVALVSPDGKDLTIIIETMSHDHSFCIRPYLPAYSVTAQNATISLAGSFATIQQLNVWYSKLDFVNRSSILFENLQPLKVVNSQVTLSLGIDEVYTLTTLSTGQKGQYNPSPPSQPFPLPYSDNFESYQLSQEPFNLAQQTGSFEIVQSDALHGKVVRQMMLQRPVAWCDADQKNAYGAAINMIGNYSWTDIYVEVDAAVGAVNGTNGVFVAARVQNGGCDAYEAKGIFFFLFPQTKRYIVSYDLAHTQNVVSGNINTSLSVWNKLSLLITKTGAIGSVNNNVLFNVSIPNSPANGFAALGTESYGIADFDNFLITSQEEGLRRMQVPAQTGTRKGSSLYFSPEIKKHH
ncbi:galactocerebrosidase-like isoform X1 [Pomacea canaliculata]|uniref:galactocerebrosidase-like isoform X1 n=1 Tax=Pomacea canaliculata TaxID=400727 RepID=UPI000D725644|nr:galactocerebrosidase-like isoform X1 [Pomacea canaliculata]